MGEKKIDYRQTLEGFQGWVPDDRSKGNIAIKRVMNFSVSQCI